MDIRTKLALALVAVALTSMFLLGSFAYKVSADLLQQISERQLDALAEAKEQDLAGVLDGLRSDVRLIRSRTQLRIELRALQAGTDPQAPQDIRRILDDALTSGTDVKRITLFDRQGSPVASAGSAPPAPTLTMDLDDTEVRYAGLFVADEPHLIFHSAVVLDGERIGGLETIFTAAKLQALAANYRGLGERGETLIFARRGTDDFVLLHAPRHPGEGPIWDTPPDYVRAAVAGEERLFTRGVRDYRDEPVWAATRYLPEPRWGLVVKADVEEETARARLLRGQLIDLGLALGAFAVLGGTALGFYLARPIRELAQVIERARQGDASARANAASEDEIGLLAETLNDYLDAYGPYRPPPDTRDGDA